MTDQDIPISIIPKGELMPIFPITNFICFPKVIFPLHIFEPRYRRMLADIQSSGYNKFVITSFIPDYTSSQEEKIEKNIQLYHVGVLCQILQIEALEDGRRNIIVEGIERVEIKDFFRPYSAEDYAIGEVRSFEEEKSVFNDREWKLLSQRLYTLFKINLDKPSDKILTKNEQDRALELEETINTICQFLQVSIQTKFHLLEQNKILDRAHLLLDILLQKYNSS